MKWALMLLSMVLTACGGSARVAMPSATQAQWSAAREHLARLRALSGRAYVQQIRIAMREPRSRRIVTARGAVAVRPGDAMRMILVGPGGSTTLDAWVTRDRWRFAVPALELQRRGEASPPGEQGLPIAFFRWWFLSRFEGRLLDARVESDTHVFVLREGAATVLLYETVRARERQGFGVRREQSALERIEWVAEGDGPSVGDRARYLHAGSGFSVEVVVDAVGTSEPDPAAFLDPDDPGVAL